MIIMRPLLTLCLLAVSFWLQNCHGFWTNSATTVASKPGYIPHRTLLRPGIGPLPRPGHLPRPLLRPRPLPRPRPRPLPIPRPRPLPIPLPRPRPQTRVRKWPGIVVAGLIWLIACAIWKGCRYCCCSTPPDRRLRSNAMVFRALTAQQDHQKTDATATADGLLRWGGPSAQPGSDTPIGQTSSAPPTLE